MSPFGAGHLDLPGPTEARRLDVAATPVDLDSLVVSPPGRPTSTAQEIVERWGTTGLVVLHGATVAAEWSAPGQDPGRAHRCYSVTKSMTGTILADVVARGELDRGRLVAEVVPALAGSGAADATVADVADMLVDLAYAEDYSDIDGGTSPDGGHDFGDYVVALGLAADSAAIDPESAQTIRLFLTQLGRGSGPHGRVFRYATPVTDIAGWLVEAATGRPVVDLFVERIWALAGAEDPARWGLDPEGTASVGAGLEVSTRDLARIGLLLSERARGRGDSASVRVEAMAAIREGGDAAAFVADGHYAYLEGYTYRDMWWMPGGVGRPLSGWGIFGQFLWIDPDADVVVACHCRGDQPSSPERDLDQDALCRAVVAALTSAG